MSEHIERPLASVGGQALIEGVMMKGSKEIAIAVRTADQGITIKKEPVGGIVKRLGISKVPFLRGALTLIDSMVVGIQSLTYSAELLEESFEEEEPDRFELFLQRIFKEKTNDVILYFSVFVALLMSVGIFIIGPTFVVGLLKRMTDSHLILNLAEGVLRLVLFIGYVLLMTRLEEMRKVFQYHGAEHKAIYCYENGEELTVENTRKYTTLHPRCGTNFMFIVMMVSMIVFSFVSWSNPLVRAGSRLLLLPVVAGISYEVIRLAGKSKSKLVGLISYPGLMMQKLTTLEPNDSQIEVALAALKSVLAAEGEIES